MSSSTEPFLRSFMENAGKEDVAKEVHEWRGWRPPPQQPGSLQQHFVRTCTTCRSGKEPAGAADAGTGAKPCPGAAPPV
jgi:hypothetical protein